MTRHWREHAATAAGMCVEVFSGGHDKPSWSLRAAMKRVLLVSIPLGVVIAIGAAQAQIRPAPDERKVESSDATLKALAVSTSGDDSSFGGSLTLSPAFASATTSYTASVAQSVTHVQLTPTANEQKSRVAVSKAPGQWELESGQASPPIALQTGVNAIKVYVTAADGETTRTYSLMVTRKAAPPVITGIAGGVKALNVKFTLPAGAQGATLQYRQKSPQGTWRGEAVSAGQMKAREITINRLADATTYEVRMIAQADAFGKTDWSRIAEGTTQPADDRQSGFTENATLTLWAANSKVMEDVGTVTIKATLGEAAPAGGVKVTLAAGKPADGGHALPAAAVSSDNCATGDYVLPAVFTIPAGKTSGTADVKICNDSVSESVSPLQPSELLALTALTSPSLMVSGVTVTIVDDDHNEQGPGRPVLTALTEGGNAPTEDKLTFSLTCVSGSAGDPLTTYVLQAVNTAEDKDAHSKDVDHVQGCNSITATMTGLSGGQTYKVRAAARTKNGRYGPWSEPVNVATADSTKSGGGKKTTSDKPLTAAFEDVPSEHPGSGEFTLRVRFSEALGANGQPPVAASFSVQRGELKYVKHVEQKLWQVGIAPNGWRDVEVKLDGGRVCGANGSVCTAAGSALANTVSATVPGPPSLHLAGGHALEGKDEAVTFVVKLNRPAARKVTVDYATADGTAVAGADYKGVSGTLVFAPQETEKVVRVAILDDAVDEGKEDFFLQLNNPQGAHLGDKHREAKGIIDNDDPLQKMWLSRFGRTVGTQAVEAIGARFAEGGRHSYLNLAGGTLGGAFGRNPGDGTHARLAAMTGRLGQQVGGETSQPQPPYTAAREVLPGSSFRLSSSGDPGTAVWSAWGHFASDGFDAEVDGVTLSGEVATGFIGGDVAKGRWLAGLALGLSEGEGPFALTAHAPAGRGQGRVETDLRAAYPYARLAVSERLYFWAVGGIGEGSMTIVEGGGPLEVDTRMRMGAVGSRGTLVGAGPGAGFELALKSDLLFVHMQSEGLSGPLGTLAATSASVSRLRVLLQGSRSIALTAGGVLRPSLEVGVRHDGGNADAGSGVEAGARLAWTTAWGLTAEAAVRGLLAHEATGYEEWGASASLLFDPGRGGLGLTASVTPAWGAASNGVERLWGQQTAARLSAPEASESNAGRLAAEVGYGVPTLRGRGILTPYVRAMLLEGNQQAWQLGTRLALAESIDLSLEASRRDGATDPEHAVALRAAYGW